jgi:hypothetical protein
MQLPTWIPEGHRPKLPPLWIVSRGDKTAGPVSTPNLVRSIALGRVPDDCIAKPNRYSAWRTLEHIREVRAALSPMSRAKPAGDVEADGLGALLRLADTREEAFDLALRFTAKKLGADFGHVHCFEGGHHVPVTRHAVGHDADFRLGAPLLENDYLAHVARTQQVALGAARDHLAYRAAAWRLGGRVAEVDGVAMVPIVNRRGTMAMIELGRVDRPFRTSDGVVLREVAAIVSSALTPPRTIRRLSLDEAAARLDHGRFGLS